MTMIFMTSFWLLSLTIFVKLLPMKCYVQVGPDPWDYEGVDFTASSDILPSPDKTQTAIETNNCIGDWFFRRLLTFFVKGSQVKFGDDDIETTVHLKYTQKQLEAINNILKNSLPIDEEMYRRAVGYVEDAIYKPSIFQTIALSWSEYVMVYLEEYKLYITWISGFLGMLLFTIWMKKRMSRRHIMLFLFILLYFYEAFVSYKEAERQDYEHFIASLNSCKWQFWSSACDVPPPNPLILIRHMHPLKIAMRLFSVLITEPLLSMTDVVKSMIDGMCDGLWFPLNKIVYIVLILVINLSILMAVLLMLCNFLLNIPFNLSFFAGLISIGVRQRRRGSEEPSQSQRAQAPALDHGDRISGPNLDKLLSVVAQSVQNSSKHNCSKGALAPCKVSNNGSLKKRSGLIKSASTGRLYVANTESSLVLPTGNRNSKARFEIGSGDFT